MSRLLIEIDMMSAAEHICESVVPTEGINCRALDSNASVHLLKSDRLHWASLLLLMAYQVRQTQARQSSERLDELVRIRTSAEYSPR